MSEESPIRIFDKVEFQNACVLLTWNEDAANLGSGLADYLTERYSASEFAGLDPGDFFTLGGVAVEDDVAVFPETNFYYCNDKLALFSSNPPRQDWYRFLNSIVDVARDMCHVSELYVTGGMISLAAHTAPRSLITIANSPQVLGMLTRYGVASNMNYETPPGQRPTLNSFMLWMCRRRSVPAATLWVPVPFYLVGHEDPQAEKKILEFLEHRFDLGIDFGGLDQRIAEQNERIAEARGRSADVDGYIRRLENCVSLTEEESEKLIKDLDETLWAES